MRAHELAGQPPGLSARATIPAGMLTGMGRKTNAQLTAELQALKDALARSEEARKEAQAHLDSVVQVQWSARIPKTLRDAVHAARGERSAQDVTVEALTAWLDSQGF